MDRTVCAWSHFQIMRIVYCKRDNLITTWSISRTDWYSKVAFILSQIWLFQHIALGNLSDAKGTNSINNCWEILNEVWLTRNGDTCTVFLYLKLTVVANIDALHNCLACCGHVASFRNEGGSKTSGIENEAKFRTFWLAFGPSWF